ncbi:MAG: glutathione peroxidase, partial [Acholeplasmataceae bacterium]
MSIYDFKVLDVRKREVDLKKFQGNILLIVNTATKCTYSQQYVSLNKLYEEYNSVGLEILDFPCNQFLFQAPG